MTAHLLIESRFWWNEINAFWFPNWRGLIICDQHVKSCSEDTFSCLSQMTRVIFVIQVPGTDTLILQFYLNTQKYEDTLSWNQISLSAGFPQFPCFMLSWVERGFKCNQPFIWAVSRVTGCLEFSMLSLYLITLLISEVWTLVGGNPISDPPLLTVLITQSLSGYTRDRWWQATTIRHTTP